MVTIMRSDGVRPRHSTRNVPLTSRIHAQKLELSKTHTRVQWMAYGYHLSGFKLAQAYRTSITYPTFSKSSVSKAMPSSVYMAKFEMEH